MEYEGKQISSWQFQQQVGNALRSKTLETFAAPQPYWNEDGIQGTFAIFKLSGKYIIISRSNCSSMPLGRELAKEIETAKDVTSHDRNYRNDHGILGGCATLLQGSSHYMVTRTNVRERAIQLQKHVLSRLMQW